MTDIKELRAKFMSEYANLPVPERVQVVVLIDDEPYSWTSAHNEISNNTKLGIKILEKMKYVGIL